MRKKTSLIIKKSQTALNKAPPILNILINIKNGMTKMTRKASNNPTQQRNTEKKTLLASKIRKRTQKAKKTKMR